MRAYRVKAWNEIYENNRSRTVKELQWVAIPNRHDGEGFKRVMQHERTSEIFAAFILTLQVASRCQPRGTLIRDGRPHDAASLALKTGGRREWFELALEILASSEIGWLESFDVPDSQPDARHRQDTDSLLSASCQPTASKVTKEGREGMEGERIPPALKLAERISSEKELGRISKELEKLGTLEDHDKGTKAWKRIVELTARRTELRELLGVKA